MARSAGMGCGDKKDFAWLLPAAAAAFVIPETFYAPLPGQRWQMATSPAIGVLVGVLWQLLYRRDPTERLVLPALAIAAYMTAWITLTKGRVSVGLLLFFAGLVTALVLTEHVLRRRDRRLGTGYGGPDDRSSA